MQQRIPEIDLLRTVAILLMIVYHTAFDLQAFYGWAIDLRTAPWETLRITIVSLFLIASGVSSHFSKRPVRRALIVLGAAALVTIATYLYDPSTFIYFGILHCIGLGMLLLIPLKRFGEWTILIGLALALAPALTAPRPTLDYYPLVPWFGLMLIGAGIGHFLYIRKNVSLSPALSPALTLPARHALLIYLIHQPVLLVILKVIL